MKDRRPSARPGAPAPGTALFAARASSGFCLGGRGNRRCRSSFAPQGVKSRAPITRCRKAQVARDPRNVSESLNLALFLTQPTVRTLRLLSCPPRSLVPSAHPPSLNFPRIRSHSRENANAVIAVDPCLVGLRDSSAGTVLAWKTRRELSNELRCCSMTDAHR